MAGDTKKFYNFLNTYASVLETPHSLDSKQVSNFNFTKRSCSIFSNSSCISPFQEGLFVSQHGISKRTR